MRSVHCALLAVAVSAPVWAATFGTVVPIGGNASDIVLDEPRGVLYIANFTANRIDVMNLSDLSIAKSINVNPQPGSMSLSPDGTFLVIGHYGKFTNPDCTASSTVTCPPLPQANALTVINLASSAKQTFSMGFPVLGVAFGNDGQALVVTTNDFLLFDPVSGALQALDTIAAVAGKTLPVKPGTFPPQITTASLAASGDGTVIYGLSDTIFFTYTVSNHSIFSTSYVAQPPLGPRLTSVNRDGSIFAYGWAVSDITKGYFGYQFPIAGGALNIGTHAIDSVAGVIYAQVPEQLPPPAPPTSTTICLPDGRCVTITNAPSPNATPSTDSRPANLMVADLDNLNVRERFLLAENLGGRSVLNKARTTMYSISDSGVTVFPIGQLQTVHRVAASQEDVVFRGNACDRRIATQTVTISDPGGMRTDFSLTPLSPGVSVFPSSGLTPAKVQISYDPVIFQNQKGTASVTVKLKSAAAVNIPQDIRVLINNHDADQRGSFVNVPGRLVDVLPDPGHDRYYVLRQDRNQVLVFDAGTNLQTATLRTSNTPTQMAITGDGKYLLVGHNDAQIVSVFDLDTLEQSLPIRMPDGHYPRSVAVSGTSILAASRVAGPKHKIDKIDILTRKGTELATLGVFENNINIDTVLVASPNGSTIMAAMADGTTLLYDSNANAFTVARKDFTSLSGAYAASSFNQYVIGNNILNGSLVQSGQLGNGSGTGAGISAGIAFMDQTAYRTTSTDASGPGVIQKLDLKLGTAVRPTRMIESPLFTPVTPPPSDTTPVTPAPVQVNTFAFRRTLAPLINRGTLISLSQSGFTILPTSYDAPAPIPQISKIVNAADQTQPVAPGGLINVMGTNLSLTNVATSQVPTPTALGESCLTVNGIAIPLLLVSGTQINAQLPFNIDGNSQMVLRTPGGTSDNLNFTILPTAPSVFRSSASGIDTASVVRAANNDLVSDSNPVQAGDELVIYATGLGRTSPAVNTGEAAPSDPLASAMIQPDIALDGQPLVVDYAGLMPGRVGVYQINVRVPAGIHAGSSVPLTIQQGSSSTAIAVQVADQ